MANKHKPNFPRFAIPVAQNNTIQPPGLDDSTIITVNGETFKCDAVDLEPLEVLGRGAYGDVTKMKHKTQPGPIYFAVKRIQFTIDNQEQRRALMDVEVSMRGGRNKYIVDFYGALFREGDIWILMEIMDSSLDRLYPCVYKNSEIIPENVLAQIAYSIVMALNFLKETLKVIHRDVKPSNVLVNRQGEVKLCDFGISGQLVNSIAKTMDAGCKPYMAPERIYRETSDTVPDKGYDVRSDVWSLGVSLVELSTGQFPYSYTKNTFQQINAIVRGPPPTLPADRFSSNYCDFVNQCCRKQVEERPFFNTLLKHPFLVAASQDTEVNMAQFMKHVLDDLMPLSKK